MEKEIIMPPGVKGRERDNQGAAGGGSERRTPTSLVKFLKTCLKLIKYLATDIP